MMRILFTISLLIFGQTLVATGAPAEQEDIGIIVLPFIHDHADTGMISRIEILSDILREQVVSMDGVVLANPWFGTDTLDLAFDIHRGEFLGEETGALAHKTGAAVVMQTVVSTVDSLIRVQVLAVEIGSGVAIADRTLDLPASVVREYAASEAFLEALGSMLAHVVSRWTLNGYPFGDEEIGILFLGCGDSHGDPIGWSSLVTALTVEIDSLAIFNARVKSLQSDREECSDEEEAEQLSSLARSLDARIVILSEQCEASDTGSVSLWFFDPFVAAAEARIPLTPSQQPFARFELTASAGDGYIQPTMMVAGRLLYESGRYETAAGFFGTLDTLEVDQASSSPWPRFLLAQALHSALREKASSSSLRVIQCEEILAHYQFCGEKFEQLQDDVGKAYLAFNGADVNQFREDWSSAIEGFEDALKLFKELDLVREQILTYNMLGGIHRFLGDWDEARDVYVASVAIAQRAGDALSLADAYSNLGMLFEIEQKPDSALIIYHRSLELQQSLGDQYGVAETHGRIGVVYKNLGQADSASLHLQEQVNIGLSLKSEPILAKGYFNLGIVKRGEQSFDEALELFRLSLTQMELMGDLGGVTRALNNIGAIHHEMGDTTEAMEFYQESLKTALELDDKSLIARCYTNIGDVHRENSDFDVAVDMYENAVDVAEEAGDISAQAVALFSKGLVRIKEGRITDGYLLVRDAVRLGESVDPEKFVPQREFLRRLEDLVGEP